MKKEFDAVKMMLGIRDKLTDRYLKTPELEDQELEEVREKYNIKIGEKGRFLLPSR